MKDRNEAENGKAFMMGIQMDVDLAHARGTLVHGHIAS